MVLNGSPSVGGGLPPRRSTVRIFFTANNFLLLLVGAAGASILGALTNSLNGWLSPQYFRDVMGWAGTDVWSDTVREGMLEGVCFGTAYALMFVTLIAAMSRGEYRLNVAIRYALIGFAAALASWFAGGIVAIIYVYWVPDANPRFFGWHFDRTTRMAYGWVRGSIWGIVFGGPFVATLSAALYALRGCMPANPAGEHTDEAIRADHDAG